MFLFLLSAFNCNVINVRRIFIIFLSWVCMIEQLSKDIFCALAIVFFTQFFRWKKCWIQKWPINFLWNFAESMNRLNHVKVYHVCLWLIHLNAIQNTNKKRMNREKKKKNWRIFYWALQKPFANIYNSKNAVERIKIKQRYQLKSI